MIVCGSAKDNCYNLMASYGEICVGCGCCSEDEKIRVPARLAMHQSELEHWENFDGWFDDDEEMRKLQETNVEESKRYSKEKIAKYQKLLEELERKET